MTDFSPNRALLNPKFEGYKLQIISPSIVHHDLPYRPTQVTTTGSSPLSLQEVQSRITHNHLALAPAPAHDRALYIDADHRVVLVDVDPADINRPPTLTVAYTLPTPLTTLHTHRRTGAIVHPEYPSAAFLDAHTVLVGDGHGALYVLVLPADGPATLLASVDLVDTAPAQDSPSALSPLPFRIHSAARMQAGTPIALLSSRHCETPAQTKHRSPAFDVWAVRLDIPSPPTATRVGALDVLWRRRGTDVPILAVCDPARDAFALVGSTPYRPLITGGAASSATPPYESEYGYEPTPDEIAPVPRAGEDLDVDAADLEMDVDMVLAQNGGASPYSWTQAPDAVTVSFALPTSTPASAISVHFAPTALTVHVQRPPGESREPLPRYTAQRLWDGIRPEASVWTWDREGEGKGCGLLSVHLGKANEGLKWVHVFAAAGTRSASTAADTTTSTHTDKGKDTSTDTDAGAVAVEADTDASIDVPETRDPSELHDIRASLAKYTRGPRHTGLGAPSATAHDVESGRGLGLGVGVGVGLGEGVPSLAQGEADEEVDAVVGRAACVEWVARDGGVPVWAVGQPGRDEEQENGGGGGAARSLTLLSTPLPGTADALSSLVVRTGLDGTLHTLSSAPPRWTHTGTFCALAFVLASKRDTRFVFHVRGTVLAFEDGAAGRGGNVYVYRDAGQGDGDGDGEGRGRTGLWAPQSVVRVGEGAAGGLLGVGAFVGGEKGEVTIVCLCENQLVLLRGVV